MVFKTKTRQNRWALGVAFAAMISMTSVGFAQSQGGRAAILNLAEDATHPSREVRAVSLAKLQRWENELGIGAAARYLGDRQPEIRHAALDWIGAQRSPVGVAYLSELHSHKDVTMRRDAIAWLEAQAHTDHRDEVARALLPFLADPSKEVRLTALSAVAETGHPSIVRQVARLYDVPDAQLRLAAVSTLKRVWDITSADALQAFVNDPDPAVRKETYLGLAQFGGSKGFQLLVDQGLYDKDREVRMAVIGAVADLRLGMAIDTLRARFEYSDTAEQKALVAALATIGTPGAQSALRELNAGGDMLEQVIVARIWSETREKVALEQAALVESMTAQLGASVTKIEVSIDPTYGAWVP